MENAMNAKEALPMLMTTQLMSAEVYSRFLHMGGEPERKLWSKMLGEEVDHIEYLRNVMNGPIPDDIDLPLVNIDRMNKVCERITLQGMDSFMLRLEGALRLECAELDFGLESLAAKKFAKENLIINYPGDINKHLDDLKFQAQRYAASPNISMQIARLSELQDANDGSTTTIRRQLDHV
jgi:hypothetical protein